VVLNIMPPKGAKRTKRGGKAEEPENVAGSSADQDTAVSENVAQPLVASSVPLATMSAEVNDVAPTDVVR